MAEVLFEHNLGKIKNGRASMTADPDSCEALVAFLFPRSPRRVPTSCTQTIHNKGLWFASQKKNRFIFHHCPCSQCWKIKMSLFQFGAGPYFSTLGLAEPLRSALWKQEALASHKQIRAHIPDKCAGRRLSGSTLGNRTEIPKSAKTRNAKKQTCASCNDFAPILQRCAWRPAGE